MGNKAGKDVKLEMCPETGFVTEVPIVTTSEPQGGLDQVREILFGAMAQSLEQRLCDISASTEARISQLERHVKDELTSLLEKLVKQLKSDMASCISATERTSTEISAQMLELRTETSAELSRQVNLLMEEVDQRTTTAAEDLAREVESLRGDFVDRASLAALFGQASRRVSVPEVAE